MRFQIRRPTFHLAGLLAATLALGCANKVSAESILLQGATVHTVSGEVVTNGQVVIEGGKIKTIADGAKNLSANKKIDLKGLHLYPGMVALNTALGLGEISGIRSTRDFNEVGEYTPNVQSWIAVNPDSELIPVARANGVAYIEPAPQGGIVAGQSGLMILDGWTTEEMTFKKAIGLHVYWPEMDLSTTPKDKFKDQSKWKSLEDQGNERRKKIKAIDDFFSDARAYAKAREAGKAGSIETDPAWEAMLPYLRAEKPLMLHADDLRQIKSAVNWAQTNKLKMVLVGARDAWMITDLLVSNKVTVLYEHVFTQPVRDSDSYDIHFKAPELLRKAGVKVATGMGATAFDAALIKNLPYQAAQAVAFGFPREEAIKSITLYPAEIAGMADRIGSLETGKDATIVAFDGDILDIRANPRRMWIAGKEVSLETRHTRLYEKYKNRPKAK